MSKLVCYLKFGVVDQSQWREIFPDDVESDLEKLRGKKFLKRKKIKLKFLRAD